MNLPITLTTTSILVLIYLVLSLLVVRARFTTKTSLGERSAASPSEAKGDENDPMLVAVRRHGNFAEYVPLSLLMIALLEGSRANRTVVLGLAVALVVGRLLHPFGLKRPAPNPFRGGGIMLQWGMLLVAGVYGLMLALGW